MATYDDLFWTQELTEAVDAEAERAAKEECPDGCGKTMQITETGEVKCSKCAWVIDRDELRDRLEDKASEPDPIELFKQARDKAWEDDHE